MSGSSPVQLKNNTGGRNLNFYILCSFILLLAIVLGLVRILKGPSAADRMMAAQLFGTCGVAILLLLEKGLAGETYLSDIALVFALLASLATTTFVHRAWSAADKEHSSGNS
ncbi:MAG: multiple resistance and pH regulation protein F [Proteobacteria bacterium]|nr:multiple resistance and pH regulation protein F [Pseudomonadota bacterium]MBU1710944.1 multiple resistance and pH regulation protein F [Pseudomonadota bacterium]